MRLYLRLLAPLSHCTFGWSKIFDFVIVAFPSQAGLSLFCHWSIITLICVHFIAYLNNMIYLTCCIPRKTCVLLMTWYMLVTKMRFITLFQHLVYLARKITDTLSIILNFNNICF